MEHLKEIDFIDEEGNALCLPILFKGSPRQEVEQLPDGKELSYISMEYYGNPTWDKSIFSDKGNSIIEDQLDVVIDEMCSEFEKLNGSNI